MAPLMISYQEKLHFVKIHIGNQNNSSRKYFEHLQPQTHHYVMNTAQAADGQDHVEQS